MAGLDDCAEKLSETKKVMLDRQSEVGVAWQSSRLPLPAVEPCQVVRKELSGKLQEVQTMFEEPEFLERGCQNEALSLYLEVGYLDIYINIE